MTGPIPRQLDRRRLGDHLDRLYRAAWGLCGSREEAEDLVQETFARVLAKPRFLRSDDDLGYLLSVLRNTFYSDRRTAARRPVTAPMPDEGAPLADTVSPSPHEALEARAVYAAIAALPPDFRDVVVAVDVTGLSYDEAARALRVPPGTVMSRLYRARRRIADALE